MEMEEAKQVVEEQSANTEQDLDAKMDAFLDEQETLSSTSDEESTDESTDTESSEEQDLDKKGDDTEDVEDDDIPKEYHKNPAWQRILKQRDEARQQIEDLKKPAISEEERKQLDEFKTVISSPEYIRTSMKAQGYTDEAINRKLQEAGHAVEAAPQDDVNLIIQKLDLLPDNVDDNTRDLIGGISKIADVIVQDRISKILPNQLKPVEEILQTTRANQMVSQMQEVVKSEGVLDFKQDIEPVLNKFLDNNPKATQEDLMFHFKDINHKLTIERLRTKGRKESRDQKKEQLRQNTEGLNLSGKLPEKTGNFDQDADAFLDALGVN